MIRLLALLFALTLAGCASKAPVPVADSQSPARIEAAKAAQAPVPTGKVHVVKKGDTLFGVAREHGLNPRDLSAWNNLDNSNRISVGQQLRLSPPTAQPAATVTTDGTEVRPITATGGVVARPLDGTPAPAVAPGAVSPAPTLLPGNSETLKRGPKGGKLPYSEENLARLKGEPAPAAAQAAAPAVPAPAPTPEKSAAPPIPPVTTGIDWGWPAAGRLLANFSDGNAGAQGLNRGVDIAGNVGEPVLAAAPGKVIFVGVYPKHGNLVVLLHAESYSSVYAHNSRVLVKEGQMVKRGQRIADLGNSDADQPKLHFEVRQQGKPVDPLKFLPPR
jgi:lipoprotein NlpD